MPNQGYWGAVFERIPDGVCLSAKSGRIVYMNPAAQRIIGASQEDVEGRTLCELVCGSLAALESGECASECPLRQGDGAPGAVSFKGRYFGARAPARAGSLRVRCMSLPSFGLPADEGRRLSLLEEAPAGADENGLVAARDLREPLSTILLTLRELQDAPPGRELQPSERRMLALSLQVCRRLLELVGLKEEESRLDREARPALRARVALGPLIDACLSRTRALSLERQVGIDLELPPSLEALGDPELLRRVFESLLVNQLKTTPSGGRLRISGRRAEDGFAEVRVEDSGMGMPPEAFAEIFDRLYRARAARDERRSGLGLRWAFCQRAVSAMGGRFETRSEPGAGNRFIVRLPAPRGPAGP